MAAELKRLVADFGGKIPADVRRELRPGIRRSATPALTEVRDRARWSTRIPRATRLSIRLSGRGAGVSIVTNPTKAPHAVYYENDGDPGEFFHPVYGNRRVWVSQQARPFAWPGVVAKVDEVAGGIADVTEDVFRANGFH